MPSSSSPAAPDAQAAAWSWTVSVRSLCEFTAKHGDLDRRFTPSATALEGIQAQQGVAARRGPDYETEIALDGRHGPLQVRGRADGWDPRRRTLEEIKTIRGRPEDIPDNRRRLHWAQLQTYGALFCASRGLEEVALALVYVDVASQAEFELREVFGAQALQQAFERRCAAFEDWARQEALHREARDAALARLPFPQPEFRPGQRALAEAVYRTALRGRSLLAQAPTGIGKTVGTLFPALRAVPAAGIDRLAYLTCKGTGRLTALEALQRLCAGAGGGAPRVLVMVAKEQACEHPDKACHGESCPLARGFYDKLPAARAEAVALGWLDAEAQRRIARRHALCPYYLGQELLRWTDVLVGDVHHLFDANGALWALAQAQQWRLSVLVDEAHNLAERARQMYTAELRLPAVRAAARSAPALLKAPLHGLARALATLAQAHAAPYAVLDRAPDPFVIALQKACAALSEHFHRQPLAVGSLLQFHFELQRFARLVETLGEHALLDLQRPADGAGAGDGDRADDDPAAAADDPADDEATDASGLEGRDEAGHRATAAPAADADPTPAVLTVRCVVPAPYLRPRFGALHGVTLFSATLAPAAHAVRVLGLPEDSAWIDVPPAFDPSHLQVRVADGLSTRYAHRTRSLRRLVGVIAAQFDDHPGNYLAFFSSFDYLEQVAEALARARPDIPQWRQDRRMGPLAREAFLARFRPEGRGVGLAVLGGVFAEGVDLPGSQLIGAFVATLALPPVSPIQQAVSERLDRVLGQAQGQGDLVPAMHKVVQAAGRVLRTPQDRGWLWLLDERYRREEVLALLPAWWGLRPHAETVG